MTEELIPDVAFADNTQQRTPCALVLDASTSMQGKPMEELNAGLATLQKELQASPLTAMRVQVLVVRVGGRDVAEVTREWCDAIDFEAPVLEANGTTPLGKGVAMALERIEAQKAAYDRNGISSTRPWLLILSDGEPNDNGWEAVARRCRQAEKERRVVVFPIGTAGANMDALAKFSSQKPRKLQGLRFSDMFVWLSRSMSVVSRSAPGERVQLPAADWSEVDV